MKTIALPIEKWCELAKNGERIPVEITLAGASMQPLIRMRRDTVTIEPFEGEPEPGDIVLFKRSDGAYVVHRIMSVGADTVITLGDNCENPDAPVRRENILGKVIRIQRGNRVIIPGSKAESRYSRVWTKLLPLRRRVLHYKFVLKKNLGGKKK